MCQLCRVETPAYVDLERELAEYQQIIAQIQAEMLQIHDANILTALRTAPERADYYMHTMERETH
jgi:hypothetical protein